jgi:hypothetical protein
MVVAKRTRRAIIHTLESRDRSIEKHTRRIFAVAERGLGPHERRELIEHFHGIRADYLLVRRRLRAIDGAPRVTHDLREALELVATAWGEHAELLRARDRAALVDLLGQIEHHQRAAGRLAKPALEALGLVR